MTNLFGGKKIFAVEFEIIELKEGLTSNVTLWINNISVGDYNETGYLSAILNILNKIISNFENLWLDELNGLSCKDIFYTIVPLYNSPNSFFDLAEAEQKKLERFDKFLFEWGDGFNDWFLKVVVKDSNCKFLWVHVPLGDEDTYEVKNNIQCFDIKLEYIQKIYKEFVEFIPNELWPSLIPK